MSQRPYFATPLKPIDGKQDKRLVMAGTPAAARLHVTRNLYEITPACASDVAAFYEAGGKVEKASADGQTDNLPGTTP